MILAPLQKTSAYTLGLHCSKCTREHRIGGDTPQQCFQGAEMLGWVVDQEAGTAVCPECPAIRSLAA
jgi:hypothetical protein